MFILIQNLTLRAAPPSRSPNREDTTYRRRSIGCRVACKHVDSFCPVSTANVEHTPDRRRFVPCDSTVHHTTRGLFYGILSAARHNISRLSRILSLRAPWITKTRQFDSILSVPAAYFICTSLTSNDEDTMDHSRLSGTSRLLHPGHFLRSESRRHDRSRPF